MSKGSKKVLWAVFPPGLTVRAQVSSDPSCLAWDQATETLAGAAPIPGHIPADLEPSLIDLASWLDLSAASSLWLAWQTTALLAEPGYGHWPSSVPPAQAAQGHCPACFAATREEGRKTTGCDPPAKVLPWYSENSEQLQTLTNLMDQPCCFHLFQYQAPKKKGWRNRSSGSVQKGT